MLNHALPADPKSKPVPTLPNGHLINLPNEALLQIASHLQGTFKERTPHCDLISLVSTCKRFPPIIRKVLYTTPILDSAKVSSLLQILFRYPDLRSKFYSLTVVSNPIRGQKAVNLGTRSRPRTGPTPPLHLPSPHLAHGLRHKERRGHTP
ncbi:hypothetical protein P3342_000754 [Pyrenophora teres f. teres]|nr:hypothetical protein P3342_000754 [Pyrenophora teres f. teres]